MAQQNSFDIVSQVDLAEVNNALNQTIKEVRQRFDFKGSHANVVLEKNELVLSAEDETKLRNMNDILQQKLVRRSVPLKALSYGNIEPAAGGTVRRRATIQEGFRKTKQKRLLSLLRTVRRKFKHRFKGMVRNRSRPRYAPDVIAKLKDKDFGTTCSSLIIVRTRGELIR